MGDTADFTLALHDKISANAQSAASSLAKVNSSLRGVQKGAATGTFLGTVLGHVANKALAAGAAMVQFGLDSVMSFGEALAGAVSLRETSSKAFEALRHGTSGVEQFEQIKRVAIEMGTALPDTVKQFQKLAAAQFSMEDSIAIFKRMQDLVKVAGTGAEGAERAMLAMTQIKAKGRLQSEELLQLQEAGLSMELVFQALEKQTGKTRVEIQKLMQAGKLDAATGLKAIQDAIGMKTGGKPPGIAALEIMNSTLTGMVERAKNFAGIMLDDLAKELGPALEGLKPILEDVMAALQSPEAKSTIQAIGSGLKLIVGAIVSSWPVVKAFISGFVDGFGEALGPLKEMAKAMLGITGDQDLMKSLVPLAKDLGKVIAFTAMAFVIATGAALAFIGAIGVLLALPALVIGGLMMLVGKIGEWAGQVMARISAFSASLNGAGSAAANNLINGIISGITAGVQRVIAAVQSLGNSVSSALAGALKMHSPSLVMERLGLLTAKGFELGIIGGTPSVAVAGAELGVTAATPRVEAASGRLAGAAANANAAGGRSVNAPVSVTVNVNGAGDPKADAAAVSQSFMGQLSLAFEHMAETAAA